MKKKNKFSHVAHMRGPRDIALASARPTHAETARGGEIPRVLMFLQNRHRTSLELQLSTNTIFSSQNFSLNPLTFP